MATEAEAMLIIMTSRVEETMVKAMVEAMVEKQLPRSWIHQYTLYTNTHAY